VIDPNEINEALVESIIEVDEALMEKYFEGELPSAEQLTKLMVKAIAAGSLIPILCVSTRTGAGLDELLEFVASSCPSPADIEREANKDGETIKVVADPNGPLAAQVFRTRIDPFVQKLSFVRVFSGTLEKDATVAATGSRKGIKMSQLLEVQANETSPVNEAGPGEIVAVAKSDDLHTGSSIGDYTFPPIKFPMPMVGLAVTPKNRGDETKLSGALHKIVEEDSTIHIDHDPETKEMLLTGMSELHLQLVQERLKRRDKVEVDTKQPKVPYRETIQDAVEVVGECRRQMNGQDHFADIKLRLEPSAQANPPVLVTSRCPPDAIPGELLGEVLEELRSRAEGGGILGFPLMNMKVTLIDAVYRKASVDPDTADQQ